MSASLHLANADDAEKLLPLVAGYHAFAGINLADSTRAASVAPLLAGTPHGVVYLIGMRRAPVGYIAVSFGWSIAHGGIIGTIDEFFIRENVRGRGMGGEVLTALLPALSDCGIVALHVSVGDDNPTAQRLFARARFAPADTGQHMIRTA